MKHEPTVVLIARLFFGLIALTLVSIFLIVLYWGGAREE